jgi:hypothetical protein
MTCFHPRAEHLPTEFPVFPLEGALLLPRGRLPLNIFEPRYLAMVEDSLGAGRVVGMIQPDPSAAPTEFGPGLYQIGCLGRISSFSETDDGRFLITLVGLTRFSVQKELGLCRGYRRVAGDIGDYGDDLRLDSRPIGVSRDILLGALRRYFGCRGLEANWEAIRKIPDDMLVVTLSMICPFEVPEKQALLEAATEAERASALLALLQIGAATQDTHSSRNVS